MTRILSDMMAAESEGEIKNMSDATQPELTLLIALGSIAVHVDEMFDNTERGLKLEGVYFGAQADVHAIRSLLEGKRLKEWVKENGRFSAAQTRLRHDDVVSLRQLSVHGQSHPRRERSPVRSGDALERSP